MDSVGKTLGSSAASRNDREMGQAIYMLACRLFPICRSITGKGVRDTIRIMRDYIDVECREVPSGIRVFDWTIPDEWTVRDAYVKDSSGRKVIDFSASNLHLMSYSIPVRRVMPLAELKTHIYTLPAQPDLIPYKTAYYTDAWGFCMAHREFLKLRDDVYDVVIDTEKRPGHLVYGEYLHAGASKKEVLLYAHICHPSLANDNCSGLALLTCLAAYMKAASTHYSYRFIFAPGTIGSLAWLANNEHRLSDIAHGLVLSCIGDGAVPNYKRSRRGNTMIDRIAACTRCGDESIPLTIKDFSPYGYDERQFCSPGFDLPVGLLQRSAFGTFPEYHTSADNLDFIRPEHLGTSFRMVKDMIDALEGNWTPLNLSPKGEPQLSKYGLFSVIGGHKTNSDRTLAYLWVLNLSDGHNSLLDISERSKMPFSEIAAAAAALLEVGLIANLGFTEQ
ncbi:peptidase M28 [Rhizobium sp. YS-1r]|nr:peptidase M28 [Rhizobium sp. YS-1r]